MGPRGSPPGFSSLRAWLAGRDAPSRGVRLAWLRSGGRTFRGTHAGTVLPGVQKSACGQVALLGGRLAWRTDSVGGSRFNSSSRGTGPPTPAAERLGRTVRSALRLPTAAEGGAITRHPPMGPRPFTVAPHPTRLETRTKESNMYASQWAVQTLRRSESELGGIFAPWSAAHHRPVPGCPPASPGAGTLTGAELEHTRWDPKDGELCPSRMKSEETLMEVRSDSDVQIDRQTWV